MTVLTTAVVLSLVSQYPDWDHHHVVWLINKESSNNPAAINPAGPYYGLLQIGAPEGRQFGVTAEQLLDPETNIWVAHELWLARGWQPWPIAASYPGGSAVSDPPDRTVLSPNFNPFPVIGRTVVLHSTRSGHTNWPLEMQATLNHMLNPGTVSSHWVIGRDGEKVRVVPDTIQAWHAQEDNDNTWGIELCQGVESDGFTAEQLRSLVEVCRGYVKDFGVLPVHATTSTQPGFIGHEETAQGIRNGKTDPGSLFPWATFIGVLKEAPVAVPSADDQLDALSAEIRRVLDFKYGRLPLKPLSDRNFTVLEWLLDKERKERNLP